MTSPDQTAPTRAPATASTTAPALRAPGLWSGILLGALFYAVVVAFTVLRTDVPYVGALVYNHYALSLLEGRLDVPLQVIGLEGHYAADGRAFIYHGLGPVLTRLAALPFVDLTQTSLTRATIWLFATLGSAAFYALARRISDAWMPPWGPLVLWILVWVTGPGLVLALNGTFYHEPISLAFACAGVFLLLFWRLWEGGVRSAGLVLLMAAAAALAVHARPHVALGLYLAFAVAGTLFLGRRRLAALPVLGAAAAVMILSGLLYMQLNTLRFGSPLTVDGSTQAEEEVVYGFVYWGAEPENSPRFKTPGEGRFHPLRIPSNAFSYVLAPNVAVAKAGQAVLLGDRYGRLERPMVPLALMWTLWLALALRGVAGGGLPRAPLGVMLLATLPAALLILSYPTVTMRYRVELWPVLFVLAASGATALARAGLDDGLRRRALLLARVGVVCTPVLGFTYSGMGTIDWRYGELLRSRAACAAAVSAHESLGPDRVAELCTLDIAPAGRGAP